MLQKNKLKNCETALFIIPLTQFCFCSLTIANFCRLSGKFLEEINMTDIKLIITDNGKDVYLRTAKPPMSLYRNDSAWAIAHRPLVSTFSAYNSMPGVLWLSEIPKRLFRTAVSSLMRLPFSPRTLCVRVAMMMISILLFVLRTSTPE